VFEDRPHLTNLWRKKMKTRISVTHLIAVAVIGGAFSAGFFSGPAFAEETQEVTPFEFKFHYTADELTSTPKAEKLVKRLERAVRDECGGDRKLSLKEQQLVRGCVADTMKSTIVTFGSEAVAQAYRSRVGG
jgi:UrcA family protein